MPQFNSSANRPKDEVDYAGMTGLAACLAMVNFWIFFLGIALYQPFGLRLHQLIESPLLLWGLFAAWALASSFAAEMSQEPFC